MEEGVGGTNSRHGLALGVLGVESLRAHTLVGKLNTRTQTHTCGKTENTQTHTDTHAQTHTRTNT